jgi:hypothetical protein
VTRCELMSSQCRQLALARHFIRVMICAWLQTVSKPLVARVV